MQNSLQTCEKSIISFKKSLRSFLKSFRCNISSYNLYYHISFSLSTPFDICNILFISRYKLFIEIFSFFDSRLLCLYFPFICIDSRLCSCINPFSFFDSRLLCLYFPFICIDSRLSKRYNIVRYLLLIFWTSFFYQSHLLIFFHSCNFCISIFNSINLYHLSSPFVRRSVSGGGRADWICLSEGRTGCKSEYKKCLCCA